MQANAGSLGGDPDGVSSSTTTSTPLPSFPANFKEELDIAVSKLNAEREARERERGERSKFSAQLEAEIKSMAELIKEERGARLQMAELLKEEKGKHLKTEEEVSLTQAERVFRSTG